MQTSKAAIAVAVAFLALASSPASAAEQFDLHCEGTAQVGRKPAERWSERYRIDLASGRWCFGSCPKVNGIARFDAGEIVLTDRDDRPSGRWVEKLTISRSTGRLKQSILRLEYEVDAECEPAPFTDIPDTKF